MNKSYVFIDMHHYSRLGFILTVGENIMRHSGKYTDGSNHI